MRKATKVLLTISIIFCFVGFAALLLNAITFFVLGSDPAGLWERLVREGQTITQKEAKILSAAFITCGGIFLFVAIMCLPAAILSIMIKKSFLNGDSKPSLKAKAIALIVFGALSVELPIVPAIFLLAMKDDCFYKEEVR